MVNEGYEEYREHSLGALRSSQRGSPGGEDIWSMGSMTELSRIGVISP